MDTTDDDNATITVTYNGASHTFTLDGTEWVEHVLLAFAAAKRLEATQ